MGLGVSGWSPDRMVVTCITSPSHHKPLPMSDESKYNRDIKTDTPFSEEKLHTMEKEYGFSYKQSVNELIYAMITCRPNISFSLIKLSPHSAKPAKIHFHAIQGMYDYLRTTVDEGIYYWRTTPRVDFPVGNIPICTHSNNYIPTTREQDEATNFRAAVDSDYTGDTSSIIM